MSTLEERARVEWAKWGAWSMFTRCAACGAITRCRGRRRRHMICLDCWDAGER